VFNCAQLAIYMSACSLYTHYTPMVHMFSVIRENNVTLSLCVVMLVVAVLSVLSGAWNWLTDPETPKVCLHCENSI